MSTDNESGTQAHWQFGAHNTVENDWFEGNEGLQQSVKMRSKVYQLQSSMQAWGPELHPMQAALHDSLLSSKVN